MKRSHNRVVLECFQALLDAGTDADRQHQALKRYGRKTQDEATRMLSEFYKVDYNAIQQEVQEELARVMAQQ